MFGRDRVRPETIEVTGSGLWRITDELYDYEIMSLRCAKVGLVVTPMREVDRFKVHLSSEQTQILLNKLPRKTLQDEYGI